MASIVRLLSRSARSYRWPLLIRDVQFPPVCAVLAARFMRQMIFQHRRFVRSHTSSTLSYVARVNFVHTPPRVFSQTAAIFSSNLQHAIAH